jgi:hypothetical protein
MTESTEPTDAERLGTLCVRVRAAEARDRESIADWAEIADEIERHLADAKAAGRKFTHADIGRALGWPLSRDKRRPGTLLCRKVSDLLSWRRDSRDNGVEDIDPPFGGPSATAKAARSRARQVTREDPDTIIEEAVKTDEVARYIHDALAKHLAFRPPERLWPLHMGPSSDAGDDDGLVESSDPTHPKESARHFTFRETLRFAEEFAAQLEMLKFFKPADLTIEQQGILAAHLHDVQNLIAGLLERLDLPPEPEPIGEKRSVH